MKFIEFLVEERINAWGKTLANNKILVGGVKIMNKIIKKGFTAYIVGGAVRDIIMGQEPHDIDIATNMPIDELQKIFKTYDIGKSKDFGIVVVKQDSIDYEIAQWRSDGKYLDGRRPETIEIVGSFEEDASRRDFTINAMGIDNKGNIIDYFDGSKDIKNKIIRTVGDAAERFGEDYTRMLRAARFSSKLGFDIEKGTKRSIKKLSGNLKKVAKEKVKQELFKAAEQEGEKFVKYINILDELGLLKHIFPELVGMKILKHSPLHHPEGSPWIHTLEALKTTGAGNPLVKLAILLHDIGKVTTSSLKSGVPFFPKHAEEGVKLADEISKRLKLSTKEREAVLFAVANHMKFHRLSEMKPSKIVKLVDNDNWDVLTAVAKADSHSRGKSFIHAGEFEKIVDMAVEIKKKFGKNVTNNILKVVDGIRVMELTGLKPGPKVGEVIKKTTEWIINNNISDENEIENYIKRMT